MRTTLAVITLATGASLFTPVLAQEPGPRPVQDSIRQPASGPQTTEPSARKVLGNSPRRVIKSSCPRMRFSCPRMR